jgi:nicotinate phosphoribosyltransferase
MDELQDELDSLKELSYTLDDLEFLKTYGLTPSFALSRVHMTAYMNDGDIGVMITGDWADATMAETFVMSIINELVSRKVSLVTARARLLKKYAVLLAIPEIEVIDFGTRRRHSAVWHETVVRLGREILKGTSNMRLAGEYGIPCYGSMAHEIFMGVAALYDKSPIALAGSQQIVLHQWYEFFKGEHTIALTDTWGTREFFKDWTEEQGKTWKGYRQDSGKPDDFMDILSHWSTQKNVTQNVQVTFSNALDLVDIIALQTRYGKTKLGPDISFGWGTKLTNDTGGDVPSIVVKLTSLDNNSTVKLSDDADKVQGTVEKRSYYRDVFTYGRR